MYRPDYLTLPHHRRHSQQWQESCARLIAPLTICLCVIISLRYGYYGDRHVLLGPSSSRLFKANSVLVKQVEVRDSDSKGLILCGFLQKPELSLEESWNVTDFVIIKSYSRKRFSFWLNEGSRIRIGWEAQTSSLNRLQVSVFKGERRYKNLQPTNISSTSTFSTGKVAEYLVEEDDTYHTGITNLSPKSIIILLSLNVSSKVHDTSKAERMCSTKNGSCRLDLQFPNPQYIVLSTPNDRNHSAWDVELSFLVRIGVYVAILGVIVIAIFLMVKCLGLCDDRTHDVEQAVITSDRQAASETEPLVPEKIIGLPYGTDEDQGYNTSSSSDDLYDGKICVICYEIPRNCFFVPCGHCATCHDCAMRIMEGESRVCPICRRLIHKVKKLLMA